MIKGKKIFLEALSGEHESFMLSLLNDQEIAYYEAKVEQLISIEKQRSWLQSSITSRNHYLIIKSLKNNESLGYISFKLTNEISRDGHLSIKLAPGNQGKGIGVDAIKTAMKYYFYNFNMHRLHGFIIDYNAPSQMLFLGKCHWKKEGILREACYINGKYHDFICVAILKQEFLDEEKDEFYNLGISK
ncbi:MAG TPA: GNAT family protein [Bacteroidales bacterium]|nr:GNAT family protein [Bacteroidales bacterium]